MTDQLRTRRNVVVGGIAAAGLALPALAQFDGMAPMGLSESFDSIAGGNFTSFLMSERDRWEGLVGQSFRIAGEQGLVGATLMAVEQIAFDPLRPETLDRSQPFYLYFAVGTSGAPAGSRTYPMYHPEQSGLELFLGRGEDRGTETVFTALFN